MQLSVDAKMWTEPRFQALTARSGWTREEALGLLVLFWHGTKEAGISVLTPSDLPVYLPVRDVEMARDMFLQCGYLKETRGIVPGGYEIVGNRERLELLENRRKWAAQGAAVAAKKGRPPAKTRAPATAPALVPAIGATPDSSETTTAPDASTEPAPVRRRRGRPRKHRDAAEPELPLVVSKQKPDTDGNRACWDAYHEAFVGRYHVEPGRNAMTNASVATFVKRVGREVAPDVIRFYLEHSDPAYVRGCHPMNLAAKDAHALLTQCRKGQVITAQDAVNQGKMQSVQSQLGRVSSGEL